MNIEYGCRGIAHAWHVATGPDVSTSNLKGHLTNSITFSSLFDESICFPGKRKAVVGQPLLRLTFTSIGKCVKT